MGRLVYVFMFHLSKIQLSMDIHQLNSEHIYVLLSEFRCIRVHVCVGWGWGG